MGRLDYGSGYEGFGSVATNDFLAEDGARLFARSPPPVAEQSREVVLARRGFLRGAAFGLN